MGAYIGDQWKTIFHDAESLAKGTWSSTKDFPSMEGGFRRYGAGKLCEVMMMYESPVFFLFFNSFLPIPPDCVSSSRGKRVRRGAV